MGRRVISGIINAGLVFLLALLLCGCEQVIMRDLIRGRVMGGEIVITQAAMEIPEGGSYSYGSVLVITPVDITFTIENKGIYTLLLTGSPKINISGTDAGIFSVTQEPDSTINPGNTTDFILRFTSDGSSLIKNATVQIPNNDLDEGSFSFTVTGTANP